MKIRATYLLFLPLFLAGCGDNSDESRAIAPTTSTAPPAVIVVAPTVAPPVIVTPTPAPLVIAQPTPVIGTGVDSDESILKFIDHFKAVQLLTESSMGRIKGEELWNLASVDLAIKEMHTALEMQKGYTQVPTRFRNVYAKITNDMTTLEQAFWEVRYVNEHRSKENGLAAADTIEKGGYGLAASLTEVSEIAKAMAKERENG